MKVALVTGAARGLGARIADAFEQQGFSVYRADVAGGNLRMDVTDRAAVQAAVAKINNEKGGLASLRTTPVCSPRGPSTRRAAKPGTGSWP